MKDKKIALGIVALIVAIAIIAVVVWLVHLSKNRDVLLEDGMIIPETRCKAIPEVCVIHGAGCPACAIALPRLKELEQELGMNFSYYDLAIADERQKVLSLGIIPKAIPTVVIRCKVYVGVRSKEEYKGALLG